MSPAVALAFALAVGVPEALEPVVPGFEPAARSGLDSTTRRELWDALVLSEADLEVATSSLAACEERERRRRPSVIVRPSAIAEPAPAGVAPLTVVLLMVAAAVAGAATVALIEP